MVTFVKGSSTLIQDVESHIQKTLYNFMLTDELSPYNDYDLLPIIGVSHRKRTKISLLEKNEKYKNDFNSMESFLVQLASSNYRYQFELGNLYLTGCPQLNIKQSYADAALFLTLAAQNLGSEEGGIVRAQFLLGELYDPNINFPEAFDSDESNASATSGYSTPPPSTGKKEVVEISPISVASRFSSISSNVVSLPLVPQYIPDVSGHDSILAPVHKSKEKSDYWYNIAAKNGNVLAKIRLCQFPDVPRLSDVKESIRILSTLSFTSSEEIIENHYNIHMLKFHDSSNQMTHFDCIQSLGQISTFGHLEASFKLAIHYLYLINTGDIHSFGKIDISIVISLLNSCSIQGHKRSTAILAFLEAIIESDIPFIDVNIHLSRQLASKFLEKLEAISPDLLDRRTFHTMGELSRKLYPSSTQNFMTYHNNARLGGSPFSNYFLAQVSDTVSKADALSMFQISSDAGYPAANMEIFKTCKIRPGSPDDFAARQEDLIEYKKFLIFSASFNGHLDAIWELRLIFGDIVKHPKKSKWIAPERFHNSPLNPAVRRRVYCESLITCFIYNCRHQDFFGAPYDAGTLKEKDLLKKNPNADFSEVYTMYLKDCNKGHLLAMYKVARSISDPNNLYKVPQDLKLARSIFTEIDTKKERITHFKDLVIYLRAMMQTSPTHRMTIWHRERMEKIFDINVRTRNALGNRTINSETDEIFNKFYLEYIYLQSLLKVFEGEFYESFASIEICVRKLPRSYVLPAYFTSYIKDMNVLKNGFDRYDFHAIHVYTTDILHNIWTHYLDCEPQEIPFVPQEVLRITGAYPPPAISLQLKNSTSALRKLHIDSPPNGERMKDIPYECYESDPVVRNLPKKFTDLFNEKKAVHDKLLAKERLERFRANNEQMKRDRQAIDEANAKAAITLQSQSNAIVLPTKPKAIPFEAKAAITLQSKSNTISLPTKPKAIPFEAKAAITLQSKSNTISLPTKPKAIPFEAKAAITLQSKSNFISLSTKPQAIPLRPSEQQQQQIYLNKRPSSEILITSNAEDQGEDEEVSFFNCMSTATTPKNAGKPKSKSSFQVPLSKKANPVLFSISSPKSSSSTVDKTTKDNIEILRGGKRLKTSSDVLETSAFSSYKH